MTLSAKNLDNRLVEFVGPTTMKSVHLYFIQNYITTVYFIFNIYLNSNIVYMTFISHQFQHSLYDLYILVSHQFSIKKHQFFYCLFISLLHMGSSNQFNTTTLLCLFQAMIYLSVGICHCVQWFEVWCSCSFCQYVFVLVELLIMFKVSFHEQV